MTASLRLILILSLLSLPACADRVRTRAVKGLEGKSRAEVFAQIGPCDLDAEVEGGRIVASWRYDDGTGKRLVAIFEKGKCIEAKRIRIE